MDSIERREFTSSARAMSVTKHLGRLEVDYQFELGRLLNRAVVFVGFIHSFGSKP
jgi:hypothetical protein